MLISNPPLIGWLLAAAAFLSATAVLFLTRGRQGVGTYYPAGEDDGTEEFASEAEFDEPGHASPEPPSQSARSRMIAMLEASGRRDE